MGAKGSTQRTQRIGDVFSRIQSIAGRRVVPGLISQLTSVGATGRPGQGEGLNGPPRFGIDVSDGDALRIGRVGHVDRAVVIAGANRFGRHRRLTSSVAGHFRNAQGAENVIQRRPVAVGHLARHGVGRGFPREVGRLSRRGRFATRIGDLNRPGDGLGLRGRLGLVNQVHRYVSVRGPKGSTEGGQWVTPVLGRIQGVPGGAVIPFVIR